MKCPNCNKEINENYSFCKFCGFNLNVVDNLSTNRMYCHNCGKLIDATSEFCIFCGKKVDPIVPEKTAKDYFNDAELEFKMNNYDQSKYLYSKALKLDKNNTKVILGLINSEFKLKNYENVISYADQYLGKFRGHDKEKVLILKLDSEIILNEFELAITTINKMLRIKPSDLKLLCKKIDILEKLDKNEEGIKTCKKILDINNNSDEVYYKKAKMEFNLERFDESIESIKKAIEINPLGKYNKFKKDISQNIVNSNNYDIALEYFNECDYPFSIKLLGNSNNQKSLELKCECLYRLGEFDEALTIINDLIEMDRDPDYLNIKAKIFLALHGKTNSIKFFKLASESNKNYLTNLAFAYGIFGDIESSKRYYSMINCELSDLWIKYYEGADELLISGFKNDFFNYPHLCCIKIDMYLRKTFEFLNQKNYSKAKKYIKLTETYLDNLVEFFEKFSLDKKFISANYIYLGKILNKYFVSNIYNYKQYKKDFIEKFEDIIDLITFYYEVEWINFENNEDSFNNYKMFGKFYLSLNNNNAALKSFKLASNYINNDGELWLYIANLSKEHKKVFYNKALFCFDKKLSLKYDDKSKKLKSISLFYLDRQVEAINLIKNNISSKDVSEIKNYIINLNKKYAG